MLLLFVERHVARARVCHLGTARERGIKLLLVKLTAELRVRVLSQHDWLPVPVLAVEEVVHRHGREGLLAALGPTRVVLRVGGASVARRCEHLAVHLLAGVLAVRTHRRGDHGASVRAGLADELALRADGAHARAHHLLVGPRLSAHLRHQGRLHCVFAVRLRGRRGQEGARVEAIVTAHERARRLIYVVRLETHILVHHVLRGRLAKAVHGRARAQGLLKARLLREIRIGLLIGEAADPAKAALHAHVVHHEVLSADLAQVREAVVLLAAEVAQHGRVQFLPTRVVLGQQTVAVAVWVRRHRVIEVACLAGAYIIRLRKRRVRHRIYWLRARVVSRVKVGGAVGLHPAAEGTPQLHLLGRDLAEFALERGGVHLLKLPRVAVALEGPHVLRTLHGHALTIPVLVALLQKPRSRARKRGSSSQPSRPSRQHRVRAADTPRSGTQIGITGN